MDKPHDNLGAALDALAKGIAPIPVVEGTKTPAVKWKEWQGKLPPEELVREWFAGTRRNIAIVCTGLVVFDCDELAKAEVVLAECGDTPHKLTTPRGGVHLGYRRRKGVTLLNQVKIKGLPIDIRTDGGLELIPASVTEHGEYRWLGELRPADELPLAKIGWTRERARQRARRAVTPLPAEAALGTDRQQLVRRARGYLATIEGAISGQRGHDRTFRAACVLARKFGLSFAEAWPLLLEWNEQCEPPWSEAELRHKLEDALKGAR
ncbi:MAG: bifunctional DNA primase/polymerase [Gemmataceae bacterium]